MPPDDFSDRRSQGSRHQDAFVVNVMDGTDGGAERCDLQDISTGGMAIAAPRKIEAKAGDSLIVQFPLGRSMSRIQTRVEIVDVSEERARLRFLDDSPIFCEAVGLAIRTWKERHSPDGE